MGNRKKKSYKHPWMNFKKEGGKITKTNGDGDKGWNELSADGFYARKDWINLRNAYRMANPLCEECKKAGKIVPMEAVDHVLSTTDYPELALSYDNLQSLCATCHAKKTGTDTAIRAGKAVRHTDPDLQRMYEGDHAIPCSYNGDKFTVMN